MDHAPKVIAMNMWAGWGMQVPSSDGACMGPWPVPVPMLKGHPWQEGGGGG